MAFRSKAILVGISGPSCSGKTTLSRLLRDVIPHAFILHEDDFFLTDSQIPVNYGLQDWDCLESLDLRALEEALGHIRTSGILPPSLVSKEDQNSVGESGVPPEIVRSYKDRFVRFVEEMAAQGKKWDIPIAIIDGFLLFPDSMGSIPQFFDCKLFLKTDYTTAKGRREARKGYVTLEGFWEDPPEYVDKIVWPNYVKNHAFLFVDGNVNGKFDIKVLQDAGIVGIPREAEGDMVECLAWAYFNIENAIRAKLTELIPEDH